MNAVVSSMVSLLMSLGDICCPARVLRSLQTVMVWFVRQTCPTFSFGVEVAPTIIILRAYIAPACGEPFTALYTTSKSRPKK